MSEKNISPTRKSNSLDIKKAIVGDALLTHKFPEDNSDWTDTLHQVIKEVEKMVRDVLFFVEGEEQVTRSLSIVLLIFSLDMVKNMRARWNR